MEGRRSFKGRVHKDDAPPSVNRPTVKTTVRGASMRPSNPQDVVTSGARKHPHEGDVGNTDKFTTSRSVRIPDARNGSTLRVIN